MRVRRTSTIFIEMTILEKFLAKSPLSSASKELLHATWSKKKSLKPREILMDFNQLDTHLYFIVSGCVRLYVISPEGEEVCLGFGYGSSLITCFQTFIHEIPSQQCIESVLDTELLAIRKTDFMHFVNEHQDIAKWYQYSLEAILTGHIQRQIELLTLNPQRRYEVFLQRSGHLVNSIPLKYIASYLMMKPETLSRVRAKIS
jgi:CRP/FNR family transcriptional regulator, anaerobic regulatory protein